MYLFSNVWDTHEIPIDILRNMHTNECALMKCCFVTCFCGLILNCVKG